MVKVICLTGGLASGKSTAVRYLADKGAQIIDADVLGHRAYDPGTEAFKAVVRTFGEEVRGDDGEIDRKVLGGKVFGKPDELKKLTDIVWPEIRRLAEQQIAEISSANPDAIIVLEAAVLFEAGWEDIGDTIWVITVDRETAIQRSIERDGAAREAVENRLNSQLSNEQRSSRANVVISNDADQSALFAQLDAAWQSGAG
jgi:phosphopantetheine adenylyltransferase/dephospho-CoA kinase